MAEPPTGETAGPLEIIEVGPAGYCDPITGQCALPAANPEECADGATTPPSGHANDA